MILIHSTNPRLSWILAKNPETQRSTNQPFSVSSYKGKVVGWFVDDNTFKIMFKDSADGKLSFTDKEFEYLDTSRFASPLICCAAGRDLLRTAYRDANEHDTPDYTTTITAWIVASNHGHFSRTVRSTNNVNIQATSVVVGGDLFRVQITSQSVRHALNALILIGYITACNDADVRYMPLGEADIRKYSSMLNLIDAPYYYRHIFSRTIQSRNLFDQTKELFTPENMILNYGHSNNHRVDHLSQLVYELTPKVLHDIGCNTGAYIGALVSKCDTYIGYDVDAGAIHKANLKIQDKKYPNASAIVIEHDHQYTCGPSDVVLITEVLEHIDKEESLKLLKQLVSAKPKAIVATVPNVEFNKYYGIPDGDTRHDDHKWEPTFQEFAAFVLEATCGTDSTVEFINVGDGVKEPHADRFIHSTIGVVIK